MYLNEQSKHLVDHIKKIFSIKNVKPIPQSFLKNIKSFTKNEIKQQKDEKFFPKEASLKKAQIDAIDTCLTAVLKIIGREDLIKKCRGNSFRFLTSYLAENGELVPLTKENIKLLKKGHIIVYLNMKDFKTGKFDAYTLNSFDPEVGVYGDKLIGGVAHFAIVYDPEKRLILHNSFVAQKNGEPVIPGGSGLKLEIKQVSEKSWNNPKDVYLLDYEVIKKMKCMKG